MLYCSGMRQTGLVLALLFCFYFFCASLTIFLLVSEEETTIPKLPNTQVNVLGAADYHFPIAAAYTAQTVQIPTPTIEPTATIVPTQTPTPEPTATPTPEPTATPTPMPTITVSVDLEPLFSKYGDQFAVDKELMKRIARCESGFNPNSDTGLYAGMFQYAAQTWISARTQMGLDTNPDLRKNPEESIRTTAFMLANGRSSAWPNCH